MKFLGSRVAHSSSKNFLFEMQSQGTCSCVVGRMMMMMMMMTMMMMMMLDDDADDDVVDHHVLTLCVWHCGTVALCMCAGMVKPVIQFGKLAPGTFSLDFKFPMCPLQAFGLFLASAGWTIQPTASASASASKSPF